MLVRKPLIQACKPLSWISRPSQAAMPLKARILNNALANQTSKMSTESSYPKEEPGDEPDDVLFGSIYGVRTIELNRPKKLNSLNGSMARKIIPRLKEWEKSQLANIIIIGGAGEKAFCAGGDVAALALQNKEGPQGKAQSKAYFALEYQLDHLIATYPKPYIAYMDGITMGGGVGLSVHAPIRIATERTVFAMPETTIGFFPDVGGSFFLPRLDGATGTYLALTSERLKGVNAFYAGVATHYIDSSSLSNLTSRLSELVFKDYAPLSEILTIIDHTIDEFSTGLPHDEPMLLAGELRKAIDRCFAHDTIEDIQQALEKEDGETKDWAEKTLQTLAERSPTSLRVTLRQMKLGRRWDIAETFQREHHIASYFMEHPDFTEGVTARLISKPAKKPTWQPSGLKEVTNQHVDDFFRTEGEQRLSLLTEGSYKEYPSGHLGLPKESEVAKVVRERGKTKRAVTEYFVKQKQGKVGVKEKVQEILNRKCSVDGEGHLEWHDSAR